MMTVQSIFHLYRNRKAPDYVQNNSLLVLVPLRMNISDSWVVAKNLANIASSETGNDYAVNFSFTHQSKGIRICSKQLTVSSDSFSNERDLSLLCHPWFLWCLDFFLFIFYLDFVYLCARYFLYLSCIRLFLFFCFFFICFIYLSLLETCVFTWVVLPLIKLYISYANHFWEWSRVLRLADGW